MQCICLSGETNAAAIVQSALCTAAIGHRAVKICCRDSAISGCCRRGEALSLVLMHMLELGGLGEVATIGIAVADVGGITLACDAKRALLRCEEARRAPMGRACIEVIR